MIKIKRREIPQINSIQDIGLSPLIQRLYLSRNIINPNQILVPEWNWLVEKFGKFGRRGNTIRDTYITLDGKSCMFS